MILYPDAIPFFPFVIPLFRLSYITVSFSIHLPYFPFVFVFGLHARRINIFLPPLTPIENAIMSMSNGVLQEHTVRTISRENEYF